MLLALLVDHKKLEVIHIFQNGLSQRLFVAQSVQHGPISSYQILALQAEATL